MLTRKQFTPPTLTGNGNVDVPNLLRAINDYWLALNQKSALEIDEARIRAAQGIVFPATQVDSTDVNTLDDYEEGTWTPTDGSGAGLAFMVNAATYTKTGRLVSGLCYVTYPATVSGAAAQINGLPFPAGNTNSAALFTNGAGGGTVVQIAGAVMTLYAPGAVAITNANLSGKFVIVRFSYEV